MAFSILHLWADALNSNGSQGNVLCLRRRMEWRGFDVFVTPASVGDAVEPDAFDLIYIGGGKLANDALLASASSLSAKLRTYVENGGSLLAVCEGLELLGRTIVRADGSEISGMDIAPISVSYGSQRLTGNLLFSFGGVEIAAFENHGGRIVLQRSAEALGRVICGHGNNELDDTVGVRFRNLFGVSACGPLLPRNPALADAILAAAMQKNHAEETLSPLCDSMEQQAFTEIASRLR